MSSIVFLDSRVQDYERLISGFGADVQVDIFTAFGAANVTLAASAFYKGAGTTVAHDGNDRIVYNTTNGNVYYDADGAGGLQGKLFATLTGSPDTLTNSDFFIAG